MSQRLYRSIKNLRKGGDIAMKARIIFSVLAVLALAASLISGAAYAAGTDGTMPGTFTLGNVAPTLDKVEIWEGITQVSSLDPLDEYDIQVTVTDSNSMLDLETVRVNLYYDVAGNSDPSTRPTVGNPQSCVIMTWSKVSGWTIDPSSGTTWVLVSANCSKPADAVTSGIFHFAVTVGKVAHDTTLSDGDQWHVYAEVYDSTGANDNYFLKDNYMVWYGEIINVTELIHWDNVVTSSVNNSLTTPMSVTYISNGNWSMLVSGKPVWINGANNASLVTNDAPGEAQFSLRINHLNNLSNSVIVPAYSSYTIFDNTGTITADVTGYMIATNNVWLTVGDALVSGTYTGEIYGRIANR